MSLFLLCCRLSVVYLFLICFSYFLAGEKIAGLSPAAHVHRLGVFARDVHVKASAVVQTLSPAEGVPAPIYRVLCVLDLMPQVSTWVRESVARSGATMALGLIYGRYM